MQHLKDYICEHTKKELIDKIQSLEMDDKWVNKIMYHLVNSPQMKDAFRKYCEEDKKLTARDADILSSIAEETGNIDFLSQVMSNSSLKINSLMETKQGNIRTVISNLKLNSSLIKGLTDIDISQSGHGKGKYEALIMCCFGDVKHGNQNQADVISNDKKVRMEVKVNRSRIGGTKNTTSDSAYFLEKALHKHNINIDIPKDFFIRESNINWAEIKKTIKDNDLFDLLVQSMLVQYEYINKKDNTISEEIKSEIVTAQGVDLQALFKFRFALALKNYAIKKDLTHLLAIDGEGNYRIYDDSFLMSIKHIYNNIDKEIQIINQGDIGKNELSSQQMKFNF